MNKEKIGLIRDICILSSIAVLFAALVGKYLIPALLPFIIAWGVAFVMRKPSDLIARKLKIKKKIIRPCLSVLIIIALIGGAIFALVKLATEAWYLFSGLSENGKIGEFIAYFTAPIERMFKKIGIDSELKSRITDAFLSAASDVISSAASVITSVISAIPGIVLFVFITVISVVYFSIDLENVNKRVHNLLPKRVDNAIIAFKRKFSKILLKYIRSYVLIMLITFCLMLLGLSVLGARYAVLMALIIAVLDLLPVIGIGIVLIPWGIYCLTAGSDLKLGVGLLVLWGVGSIVRQSVEPKIVGKELGMHPLLTLVLMYVGYSLFGFWGLILLPFLSVFISIIPPKSKSASHDESSETAS